MSIIFQTIKAKQGDCIYIPKNATIVSVVNPADLDIQTSCLDFDLPPQLCASFDFSLEDSDGDVRDATDGAVIDAVYIKGVRWPINLTLMTQNGSGVYTGGTDIMNVAGITSSVLTSSATNSQRTYNLTIKMPEMYQDAIEIRLLFNTGRWPNGLYIKPVIVSCVQ